MTWFDVGLKELAGARVAGEVPLTDAVVNRQLANRLQSHPHIESVRVEAEEGDAATIVLTPRARLVPPVRIRARIERQPEFPHHPLLLVHWTMPALGPLARLATPALGFLKALPPGVHADGDLLTVDLAVLLESRGLGEYARLVRRAALHTRPGGFVVEFELAA